MEHNTPFYGTMGNGDSSVPPAPIGILQGQPPNQDLPQVADRVSTRSSEWLPDQNFTLRDRVNFEQPSLMPQYYPHHAYNQAINPSYLYNCNQHVTSTLVYFQNQLLAARFPHLQTALVCVEHNYPPQQELGGLKKEVKVIYGSHPCDFYCQLVENFNFLSSLEQNLNTFYTDNPGRPCVSRVGACVAQFEGKWCRAELLSRSNAGGVGAKAKVEVMLVDRGNVLHVDADLVKEMMVEFLTFPPLAYRCTLAGVEQNATGNSKIKRRFKRAVLGKKLEAAFIKPPTNSKYRVILNETTVQGLDADSCINNLFMNKWPMNKPVWRPLPCNEQKVRGELDVGQELPVQSGITSSIPTVMVPGPSQINEDYRTNQSKRQRTEET